MAERHPVATEHLPIFITAPGDTDVLLVIMGIVLLLAVLGFGILYWRLHALPEQIAHRSKRLQFQLVAVLAILALFTHMHILWIAALLLALIDLPDFGTPLNRIAGSAEKIAGIPPGQGAVEVPAGPAERLRQEHQTTEAMPASDAQKGDGSGASSMKAEPAPTVKQERLHA